MNKDMLWVRKRAAFGVLTAIQHTHTHQVKQSQARVGKSIADSITHSESESICDKSTCQRTHAQPNNDNNIIFCLPVFVTLFLLLEALRRTHSEARIFAAPHNDYDINFLYMILCFGVNFIWYDIVVGDGDVALALTLPLLFFFRCHRLHRFALRLSPAALNPNQIKQNGLHFNVCVKWMK